MKKSDLKVISNGSLKCIYAYVVRFKFIDSEKIHDSMFYFDGDKANSLCFDVLSKNVKIDFCFVDTIQIFL